MTDEELKIIKGLTTSINNLTTVVEGLVLAIKDKEFSRYEDPQDQYITKRMKGQSESPKRGSHGQ